MKNPSFIRHSHHYSSLNVFRNSSHIHHDAKIAKANSKTFGQATDYKAKKNYSNSNRNKATGFLKLKWTAVGASDFNKEQCNVTFFVPVRGSKSMRLGACVRSSPNPYYGSNAANVRNFYFESKFDHHL